MSVLTIGDVLRAHPDHSVEVFRAPESKTDAEAWIAETRGPLTEPSDGGAVRAFGPSPEAAIDLLGRKLNEREDA